jgi:hypothetical protein
VYPEVLVWAIAASTIGMQLACTGPAPLPGCVSDVTLPPTSAAPSSTTPTGGTVTVTTTDNRATVNLHAGDRLVVSLPSNYDPPTVTPGGVLVQADLTGGYPTGQPLLAGYLAVASGQADVTTRTDAACLHAPTPCPSPQIPWTVHVVVSG